MEKKMILFFSAMLLLTGMYLPQKAFSLPMLEADDTGVIGINGLAIDGTKYDVRWFDGRFVDLYDLGDDNPTFWGDPIGALLAAEAISATLNDYSVTLNQMGAGLDGLRDDDFAYILVPFEQQLPAAPLQLPLISKAAEWGDNIFVQPTRIEWFADQNSTLHTGFFNNSQTSAYTNFRAHPVPEPAILYLLCSAVIGIAVARRKAFIKKNT